MAKLFARVEGTEFLHDTTHLSDGAFRALMTLAAWGAYWRTGATMKVSLARNMIAPHSKRRADRLIAELCDGRLVRRPCAFLEIRGGESVLRLNPDVISWGRVGGPPRGTVRELIERDGLSCAYCEAPLSEGFEVDHVEPLSRGGSDLAENLVLACQRCNARKHAKSPREANMPIVSRREQLDS